MEKKLALKLLIIPIIAYIILTILCIYGGIYYSSSVGDLYDFGVLVLVYVLFRGLFSLALYSLAGMFAIFAVIESIFLIVAYKKILINIAASKIMTLICQIFNIIIGNFFLSLIFCTKDIYNIIFFVFFTIMLLVPSIYGMYLMYKKNKNI